ncbi:MAG: glycine cleavage system protein GcvH [Fimbriiglobus sp.]
MDLNALRYAPSHEWVLVENGVATVGITKFAVDQLTDVTYLELPKVGKTVAAGDEIGVIESVKSTSPIYSPISGTVTAVNDAVAADTAIINANPYEAGWLAKFTLAPGATTDHLLTKQQYDTQVASDAH